MNSTLIHQIVTLFCEGASIRRIAQRLQISRRTVRRALAQLEQYLHFVESQDFATTIREHIRAFEHLRGVAATY